MTITPRGEPVWVRQIEEIVIPQCGEVKVIMHRREFVRSLVTAAAGAALLPRLSLAAKSDPWTTVYPQILERIKPPTFPKRDLDITTYGARTGAANDCTE